MTTPSQHISSKNINDEFDKLHLKNKLLQDRHNKLIEELQSITVDNTNFGTCNFIQKLCENAKI